MLRQNRAHDTRNELKRRDGQGEETPRLGRKAGPTPGDAGRIADTRDHFGTPSLLEETSNIVVSEAAKLVGDQSISGLTADLVAAFDRLMNDPEESDKQCRAKIEIVD